MSAILRHSLVLLFLIPIASLQSQERMNVSLRGTILYSPWRTTRTNEVVLTTANQDSVESPRAAKSPAVATILSAIVPGSGQIYAQRYWTLPLIWGFGYWFVRQYVGVDRKYDEWRIKYSESLLQGPYAGSGDPTAKYIRDFYRDERDRFAFYFAITYVLNIVDAYVGASLYNFDVSEDLGGTENVRLTVRLPIQK